MNKLTQKDGFLGKVKDFAINRRNEFTQKAWEQFNPKRHKPYKNSTAAAKEFQKNGVLVLPDLIPEEDIKAANDAFDQAVKEGKNMVTGEAIYEKPEKVINIPSIHLLAPVFQKLMAHPKLLPYLDATIGNRAKIFYPQGQIYPKDAFFYHNWHSDLPNSLGGIDLTHSTLFVKAIFYLRDVKKDGGAFTYLKGSHKIAPKRDFSYVYDALLRKHKVKIVDGKAGTVVLFHTSGFHRVQPNHQAERRTLTYAYTHFWMRNAFEKMDLTHVDFDKLNDTQKYIFGYAPGDNTSYDKVCPAFRGE